NGHRWQRECDTASLVVWAWKAAGNVNAAQHLYGRGVSMLGKLCGLTVLVVLLGAWAALAQTIYGSAYPAPGGVATLYTISPTTGAVTPIGSIGFPQVGSLAFAANGTLYGVGFLGGTSVLLTINTTTGAGSLVGST